MKRLILSLMVLSLLGLGGQSFAELCTIDDVPAATLLLPYFEVDLDDDNGVTTLFSINNASAAPALAHVVTWTDWSVPTIDFDIYLTGYDVVTVNLRDVFDGRLPITATPSRDSGDTISPHGGDFSDNPHWDNVNFPGCSAVFPYPTVAVTGGAADRLFNGHVGNPVSAVGGRCMGEDHGDNVARGYITIDNADACNFFFPNDPTNYFGTGLGANNVNQLWGDYFIIDPGQAFAHGETLVHIEANDDLDATTIPLLDQSGNTVTTIANPTNYTYYGRYTQALGGIDNREPLGTTWATRYLNGGAFTGGTDLFVWRDSTANNTGSGGGDGWSCGSGPDWYPLNETEVIAFDEAEDAVEICFFTGGLISPPDSNDPACFPLETGRYAFGEGDLSVPFDFGWTYLNLNLPPDAPADDVDFPAGTSPGVAQSWVAAAHDASGLFSVGLNAVELTHACQDLNPLINVLPNQIPQYQE